MIVGIHQPNFIPWLGYFFKLSNSDLFIYHDDVQIDYNGFARRVKISQPNNIAQEDWLTLPLQSTSRNLDLRSYLINQDLMEKKIIQKLKGKYAGCPYYHETMDELVPILFAHKNLTDLNINLIEWIKQKLDILTPCIKSSSFNFNASGQQKIVDLLKKVESSDYLSGIGATNYQETKLYESNRIQVKYIHSKEKVEEFIERNNLDLSCTYFSALHFIFLLGRFNL